MECKSRNTKLDLLCQSAHVAKVLARLLNAVPHALLRLLYSTTTLVKNDRGKGVETHRFASDSDDCGRSHAARGCGSLSRRTFDFAFLYFRFSSRMRFIFLWTCFIPAAHDMRQGLTAVKQKQKRMTSCRPHHSCLSTCLEHNPRTSVGAERDADSSQK